METIPMKGLAIIKNNPLFTALLFNPIVVLLYFIFSSVLLTFLDYGGVARRVPILVGICVSLLLWFILCILFKKRIKQSLALTNQKSIKISKYWIGLSLVSILGITVHTGIKTVDIAQAWGSALHRQIHAWQTETHIKLEEYNIFEQNMDELFSIIDQEMGLPDVLFISHSFELEFNQTGEITSLYTSVYGENEEGLTESFLISYDTDAQEILIHHNEFEPENDTDDSRLLSPLIDTLAQLSLEDIIQEWPNEEQYGLYYLGYRTWGFNNEGMYYLENGESIELDFAEEEIIGYTLSIYVPDKMEELTPKRFIDRSLNSLMANQILEEDQQSHLGYLVDEHGQETYFLTEDTGYRLPVIDAATGSRWYGFEKTENGGEVWEMVNQAPFDERSGVTSGIHFFDEDLGFVILGNGSQTEATLFRTENGGQTFDPIDFPSIEVPLTDDEEYNPFQFPETPYEEDGKMVTLVGQGANGDYNSGSKALYYSEDDGMTWEFVEEVSESQ
ncbi:MAG: hypothetical protein JJU16_03035 [Alkalibacterium sp.]|nr:hypothetical protein [Alkalibacterium sp.]